MLHHDLIARLPAPLVHEILEHLRKQQKPSYAVAMQTLAAQKKFRPVFVERKAPVERHAWMQRELGRAQNEALSANILSVWLTGAQQPLLVAFLDHLGIAHDGKGSIEDLPACPEREKLDAAIGALFEKFPAAHVQAYLHTFQAGDPSAWPGLGEILEQDARFKL